MVVLIWQFGKSHTYVNITKLNVYCLCCKHVFFPCSTQNYQLCKNLANCIF